MKLFAQKAQHRIPELDFDRARASIENLSARLMITDNDRVILYANPAVVNFLKTVEQDIKKHLPNFSAVNLVGVNIDTFHKNPSHQQSMLADLREAYDTSIRIGEHLFNLRATPFSMIAVNALARRLSGLILRHLIMLAKSKLLGVHRLLFTFKRMAQSRMPMRIF